MMRWFSNLFCSAITLILALSAVSQAMAQQGQYHLNYVPFSLATLKAGGGLATYSRVNAVNGQTLQLRGDDGVVYTFTLDSNTVYCQGDHRAANWVYLRTLKKKITVTVLTKDDTNTKALVVWDKPPSISTSSGPFVFTLPPMCK
jgi:predicted lipoprotein with Yx(FWY)xxD motif